MMEPVDHAAQVNVSHLLASHLVAVHVHSFELAATEVTCLFCQHSEILSSCVQLMRTASAKTITLLCSKKP